MLRENKALADILLNMKPFVHPTFSAFTRAFEDLIRAQALHVFHGNPDISDEFGKSSSIDALIAKLKARNPRRFRHLINANLRRIIPGALPFSPLGDAIFSFVNFVIAHERLPRSQLVIHDVLYRVKTSGELSDPLRVFVTDKEWGKIFVSGTVGEEYVIPTLAVLKSAEDIDRFTVPEACAIKPTNQSGPKLLVDGRSAVDKDQMKSWLEGNHYFVSREANYKPLTTKIIAEVLMVGFYEVRVFCVWGLPRLIQISRRDSRSPTGRTSDFFSSEFLHLAVTPLNTPNSFEKLEKPRLFGEILRLSSELARRFNFIRVDFYTDDKVIKVGELTHCDRGGLGRYREPDADQTLSDCLFRF